MPLQSELHVSPNEAASLGKLMSGGTLACFGNSETISSDDQSKEAYDDYRFKTNIIRHPLFIFCFQNILKP